MYISVSHNDLDGYYSQWLVYKDFQRNGKFGDWVAFNTGYGQELTNKLEKVLSILKSHKDEDNIIHITDLNLTEPHRPILEQITSLCTNIFLKDHHINDMKLIEEVFVSSHATIDKSKSASKIVYDSSDIKIERTRALKQMTDCVNASDIFDKSDIYNFIAGREISELLREILEYSGLFGADVTREIVFKLFVTLENYGNFDPMWLSDNNGRILRNALLHYNSTFKEGLEEKPRTKREIMQYLVSVNLPHEIIETKVGNISLVKDFKYGSISDVCNIFLQINPNVAAIVCSTEKDGKVLLSFRSGNHIDCNVQEVAKRLGGGGHYRAAGATISDSDWGYPQELIKGIFI